MNPSWLDTLRSIGALRYGHFVLSSGLHSDVYLEKFKILRDPELLREMCKPIALRFSDAKSLLVPEVVAGPATGGMIVAYEVARQLGLPAVYVEKDQSLRRGQSVNGKRVLVVDDVYTTGGSLRRVIEALDSPSATSTAVLVDRSLYGPFSVCKLESRTWPEDQVPDWLAKIPIDERYS